MGRRLRAVRLCITVIPQILRGAWARAGEARAGAASPREAQGWWTKRGLLGGWGSGSGGCPSVLPFQLEREWELAKVEGRELAPGNRCLAPVLLLPRCLQQRASRLEMMLPR